MPRSSMFWRICSTGHNAVCARSVAGRRQPRTRAGSDDPCERVAFGFLEMRQALARSGMRQSPAGVRFLLFAFAAEPPAGICQPLQIEGPWRRWLSPACDRLRRSWLWRLHVAAAGLALTRRPLFLGPAASWRLPNVGKSCNRIRGAIRLCRGLVAVDQGRLGLISTDGRLGHVVGQNGAVTPRRCWSNAVPSFAYCTAGRAGLDVGAAASRRPSHLSSPAEAPASAAEVAGQDGLARPRRGSAKAIPAASPHSRGTRRSAAARRMWPGRMAKPLA